MKKKNYIAFLLFALIGVCSKASQQQQDPVPLHETFNIISKQVGETRTINVWLPLAYTSSTDSLPVLYMADGGIKEDFPHMANTLAELIERKAIAPMILVGIENTQRRRDLTGFTSVAEDKKIAPVVGGSANFRSFIKEELFAAISKKYRVSSKSGIIGESLAGLFVVETLLTQPDMFDTYIAFDPSLWWNDHFLVRTAKGQLSKLPRTEKYFWFAGSGTKDIYVYTNQLEQILKKSASKTLKWIYSAEPEEQHQTIFRATKEKALVWAFRLNNILK